MINPFNKAFLDGATWGQPNELVQHLETHAAHVFLCGNRAYKIKKPVALPYLDFSTREKRRSVLQREFEINRHWVPDIYLGVSEIDHEPVLVMRRFDQNEVLKEIVCHRSLQTSDITSLAARIVSTHASAKPVEVDGARIMEKLFDQLLKAFTHSTEIFFDNKVVKFEAQYGLHLQRCSKTLLKRSRENMVRRCHGDMHCGNIIIENGMPMLFDALEFSEELATIDVLYDLAFLLMDLMRFHQRSAAAQLLNDYLDLRRGDEDLSGLIALPLFMATRAGVRALVGADLAHELTGEGKSVKEQEARRYFDACLSYLQPVKPKLICIGGLSGTGKSSLAVRMAPILDPMPGAIVIRSDVERKRLFGVDLTERLPISAYTENISRQVYSVMFARAQIALNAGYSIILDAVFLSETERNAAQEIGTKLAVEFNGFWLEANDAAKRQRISNRTADASDATVNVLEKQIERDVGRISWPRIDASGTVGQTLERALGVL
jgi:uncharacterized protein